MEAMMLHRQIFVSAFLVICLLTASADAFDASDVATRLDNLVRKSLVLEQNILSAQKSSSPLRKQALPLETDPRLAAPTRSSRI
jgi:hypothetical protein